MKKELSTGFDARQYMRSEDFEIFFYKDINPGHIRGHRHTHYEIYFFLEGDADYVVDGSRYELQYGDCLFIPPGKPHHPVFCSSQTSYRRFVLWISADYFHRLLKMSPDFGYSFDYVKKEKRYLFHTDFTVFQEIQAKLLSLIEETRGSRAFRQLESHLMAASLLLHLNRLTYDSVHQVSPAYENALYLSVCDYINSHLGEDLSLDRLSGFFYASKYHISHIFKDNMGISLHQYIIKKRLQASKNGILSGLPLCRLSQQYGFSDYTSFYRAFKKEFGLSPKEFREQLDLPEGY